MALVDGKLMGGRTGKTPSQWNAETRDVFFIKGDPRIREIFELSPNGKVTGFIERRELGYRVEQGGVKQFGRAPVDPVPCRHRCDGAWPAQPRCRSLIGTGTLCRVTRHANQINPP